MKRYVALILVLSTLCTTGCASVNSPRDTSLPVYDGAEEKLDDISPENSGDAQPDSTEEEPPMDSDMPVDQNVQGTQDTDPDPEEDTLPEKKPDEPEQDDPRTPISGKLLHYFQTEYFSAEEPLTVNLFLSSEYDKPEDVDLWSLFRQGIYGKDNIISDEKEERKARAALDDSPYDLCKLHAADIDPFLLQYLGLTLEQTNMVALEYAAYLEEYDSYYFQHSDVPLMYYVSITAGYYNENGDVLLEYYDILNGGSLTGVVRLTPTETDYLIQENHHTY